MLCKKYINDFISKKVTIKENTNTFDFGEKFDSSANYLIIRPSNYKTFDYDKITHKNAFLYIPSFLRNSDILVLNKVLDKYKNLGVFAENIGALNYNRKTIFGGKLNLKNIFSIKEIINENVVAIFASPEISDENFEILKQYFNVDFFKSDFKKFDLMTFVHCPIKTLFKNTCKDCKFAQDIIYEMEDGNKFKLNRNVIANCYFFLQKI